MVNLGIGPIRKGIKLRKMNLLLGGAYARCRDGVMLWRMRIFVSLYSYLKTEKDISLLCMMAMEDRKLLNLPRNILRKS